MKVKMKVKAKGKAKFKVDQSIVLWHGHYHSGEYWATSPGNRIVETDGGFMLEYNPAVGSYRLTHKSGRLPAHLMGYNPHLLAAKDKLKMAAKRAQKAKGTTNK